jgi:hypothetical protein
MSTNHRVGNLLAILFVGCGLVACTSTAASPTGTGGTGAGAGGTGTGGTGTGTAGSTGAGGTSAFATNSGTACLPPATSGLITDFTYMPGEASAPDTTQVHFGDDKTSLSGGEFTYNSLTATVIDNDWHITGTVNTNSGFNLYFDNCNLIDASAFKGISFTIWGTTTNNMITLDVSTLGDSVAYGWLDSKDAGSPATPTPGTCTPSSGNGPYYHPGCSDPLYTFAVTGTQAAPQTVSVPWGTFTMGQPAAGVTPNNITSILWTVPWTATSTPYAVDIHVDNLTFTQ